MRVRSLAVGGNGFGELSIGRSLTEDELMEYEFYNTGAQYMTRAWARSGMVQLPEYMTDLFLKFIPHFMQDALKPR